MRQPSDRHDSRQATGEAPAPVRALIPAAGGLLLALLALPVTMLLRPSPFVGGIALVRPDLTDAQVSTAFVTLLWVAAIVHLLYGALVVWLAAHARRGRRWGRGWLTIVVIVITVGSAFSASSGQEYVLPVVATTVLHIAILGLLWIPRSSRAYFVGESRARADKSRVAAGRAEAETVADGSARRSAVAGMDEDTHP